MPNVARRHQLQGNLLYHVFNRGNAKSVVFRDLEDYENFTDILLRYRIERGVRFYNYVIMPNHYHLLLEINDPDQLSSIMAGINKSYSWYYHKTYKTVGYLWQGRFKSKPVQKDGYLQVCARYIERNPLAQGIVSNPEDYLYSSARHYILGLTDRLLSEHPFYSEFGNNSEERRSSYKNWLLDFDEDVDEESCLLDFDTPLGDTLFSSKLYNDGGRYKPRRRGRKGRGRKKL
ncbi:transposase [Candidatus Omnitrophota bacterium]